ncbi:MAG: hypothetical protein HYV09_09365 [Deltaproteobacteria bacterium]|nr:hypothetical protein [Deltaproteobacteria bacterium]
MAFGVALVALPARAGDLAVRTTAGVGMVYVDHTRQSDAPIDTTERGFLPAAAVEAVTSGDLPLFARLRVTAIAGKTDYRVWDPTTDVFRATTTNRWITPELAIGGRLEIEDDIRLVEYVGLAYHYWARSIDAVGAADWQQRWAALAIGTRLEARVARPVDLTIEAALVPSFHAAVRIDSERSAPIDLEPTGKLGARVRVASSWSFTRRLAAGLLAGWEYAAFGESPWAVVRDRNGDPITHPAGPGGVWITMHPAERVHQLWMLATLGFTI